MYDRSDYFDNLERHRLVPLGQPRPSSPEGQYHGPLSELVDITGNQTAMVQVAHHDAFENALPVITRQIVAEIRRINDEMRRNEYNGYKFSD